MAADTFAKLLADRRGADQIYRLTVQVTNLHATQGRNDGTMKLSHTPINETRDETHEEGIKSGEKATPKKRRRGRRADVERDVQAYRFEGEKQPKDEGRNGMVTLHLGGPYGLFSKTLRDAVVAMNKAQYWLPSLSLIQFRPLDGHGEHLDIKVLTTFNVLDEPLSKTPKPRMEPRNTRGPGGRSMVPVFHERIFCPSPKRGDDVPVTPVPIVVTIDMIVNSECPRSQEEVAGLLRAMEAIPVGAARRGNLFFVAVEQLQ